jgi:hypothetical protein
VSGEGRGKSRKLMFYAGGLKRCIGKWREIGASPGVLDWIENGLNIPLKQEPGEYYGINTMRSRRVCIHE